MIRAYALARGGLVAAVATATVAAPATARIVRQVSSFTPAGIEGPHGVAVEQATGDVFVAGEGSHNVEKFSASGVIQASFVSPVFEEEPEGVTVDNSSGPSKGDVYVSGRALGIVKLDTTGAEAAGFTPIVAGSIPPGDVGSAGFRPDGVAVDPSNGNVVVADAVNNEVDIFGTAGEFVSQFKAEPEQGESLEGVAVGAGGAILTANEGSGAREWSPPAYETSVEIGSRESGYGVAVDRSTGRVFVEEPEEPRQIVEYELLPGAPPDWTRVSQFGMGLIEYSGGVAVNEASGGVYATSSESGLVEVFGPPENLPLVLTGTPATGVTATAAEVSGTVNPEGAPVTGCRFEYGLSNAYGASSPCSPAPPLTGEVAIHVTASLSVRPDETYHYRLVAVNANGAEYGEDETFQTEAPQPTVASESVSAVRQTSATLDASIDPNDQKTAYRFEYGTSTAYGTAVPVPDADIGSGFEAVHVAQELVGLAPGTTYHYRVIATNASSPAGGTVGADRTFTTTPLQPPAVGTGQASGVAQNSATLSGAVDTQGNQTEYEFDIGIDTGYGTRIFGDAGSEAGAHPFTVTLQGLMPGTTYHYRIAATNTFGTVYGLDMTFTTSTYPSAMLTAPVTPTLVPAIVLAPAPSASKNAKTKSASVAPSGHVRRRAKAQGSGRQKAGRSRRRGRARDRVHTRGLKGKGGR